MKKYRKTLKNIALICFMIIIFNVNPIGFHNCYAETSIYSIKSFATLQRGMNMEAIYDTVGMPNVQEKDFVIYEVDNDMELKLNISADNCLKNAVVIADDGTEMYIQFDKNDKILYRTFAKQAESNAEFENTHCYNEFNFVEIGTAVHKVYENVGEPNYYNSSIVYGIYAMNNGCRLHINNLWNYRVQHIYLEFKDGVGFYISFQNKSARYLWENEGTFENALSKFSVLKKSMSMDDVYEFLGRPDRFLVCGVSYDIGGEKEIVLFINKSSNTLQKMAIKDKTGRYCFIDFEYSGALINSVNYPLYLDEETINNIQKAKTYPLAEFKFLKNVMTANEIVGRVGSPAFLCGDVSGYYAYILDDGNLIILGFEDGFLIGAKLSFKDRTECIIAFDEFGDIELY